MEAKVLYISYDGMTDPLGQSQVLPYLRELSKEGYNIHLVSFEKPERFKQHKKYIQEICDDSGITWHPQDYSIEGGLRKTIRQVKRMKKVVLYLHEKHHFAMTHCRSYIAAIAGIMLKKKYGTKMIFDMRGFWADERVDGKLWDLKNPLYKFIYKYFKKRELQFFNQSNYTISLTENGKEEIMSWSAINQEQIKIEVIPCCVDLEVFNPNKIENEQKLILRNELNISESDFVLGYVGSIGTWYMLDEMLHYFKVLLKKKPNAIFLFVTGENASTIIDKAVSLGINSSQLRVTSCLHKDVPIHLSIFTESIFFIRPSYSKKASSPTKQGEIMAMGIPLTCNAGVGDTDRIVKKYKAGEVIAELNEQTFENVINKETLFDQQSTILGAEEYFGLDKGVKSYLRVYRNVLSSDLKS